MPIKYRGVLNQGVEAFNTGKTITATRKGGVQGSNARTSDPDFLDMPLTPRKE